MHFEATISSITCACVPCSWLSKGDKERSLEFVRLDCGNIGEKVHRVRMQPAGSHRWQQWQGLATFSAGDGDLERRRVMEQTWPPWRRYRKAVEQQQVPSEI